MVAKKTSTDTKKTSTDVEKTKTDPEKVKKQADREAVQRLRAQKQEQRERQQAFDQERARDEKSRRETAAKVQQGVNALPSGGGSDHRAMFFMAIFASIAVISWQEIKTFHRLPLPSRFISMGVAYGMLAIAEPIISVELAGFLAWGLFLGLVYSQSGATDSLAPKVDAVAHTSVPPGVTPITIDLGGKALPSKSGSKTPSNPKNAPGTKDSNTAGSSVGKLKNGPNG